MTAILGGGISGLSAAYYALENPKLGPLVIYEASNRLGGWVRSKTLPDGTLFEQGPRTIRPHGPAGINTLDLMENLGLTKEVLPVKYGHPAARNRLIFAQNKLHLVPNNLSALFKKNTLLNRSLLSLLWNDLKAPTVRNEDESIHSFIARRLGPDVADNLIGPMVCGICAGDAREISVNFLFESMFEAEQKHGCIMKGLLAKKISNVFSRSKKDTAQSKNNETKGMKQNYNLGTLSKRAKKELWSMWGLKGGLEKLPLTLAKNVRKRGVNIETEHKCEELRFNGDRVEITANGKTNDYSHVVSSLSARSLANLVAGQHPELSKELRAIPTVNVGIVNLQFPGQILSLKAFGFLVRPKEEIPILGVIFDSCIFPQNSTVLTVMMGGAWYEKYFGDCSTNEHLVTTAVNYVRDILDIDDVPEAYDVTILKDCIPQYVVGHKQRVNRIHNYISERRIPLALCGSSYQGVGLNDVILSAKQAVSVISSDM